MTTYPVGDSGDLTHRFVSEDVLHEGARYRLVEVREEGPDGRIWPRQIVRHPGAAVILPILDDGRVVLVRQHRTSLGRTLLELPAGVLDPGEDPRTAALRELREETGYRAGRLEPLVAFAPAPGLTDEVMHLFIATELSLGDTDPDDDEHVVVELYEPGELFAMQRQGTLEDGKTLLGLLQAHQCGLLPGFTDGSFMGSADEGEAQ